MDGSLPVAFASTESSTCWDTAQRVKCLLCKHADPSFSLQHPYKKHGLVAGTCNPRAGGHHRDKWIPEGSWPVSLTARMTSKFNRSSCFKKNRGRAVEEDAGCRLLAFTCTHVGEYTQTPLHTLTCIFVSILLQVTKGQAGNSTSIFIMFSCLRISYMPIMPFEQIHSACKPSTSSLISSYLHFRQEEMKWNTSSMACPNVTAAGFWTRGH